MAGREVLRALSAPGAGDVDGVDVVGASGSKGAAPSAAREAQAGRGRFEVGVTPGRAARALELQRSEFELAVELGHIRRTGGDAGGPVRVAPGEIERWRQHEGFPDVLRRRLRTVGTQSGAELLSISSERFTRLARTGHLVPVRFYLNRYRAVVWLYLAEEVEDFALGHPELLTGRMPRGLRPLVDGGEDLRPRTWRSKRMGLHLRTAQDAWQRAAGIASLLDPLSVADVVPDPYERSYLGVLRPNLAPLRPASAAAHDLVRRILRADHPDEIGWYRASLARELIAAREVRPAPRPARDTPTVMQPAGVPEGAPADDLLLSPHVAGAAGPDEVAAPCERPLRKRASSPGRSLWNRLRRRRVRPLV
ncbi:DUF6397 family protein [Streptomyces sp. NPDC048057]|uniref:DUF6397 family protein n=1 Tax=Streptomyces sp. NPDC048057 TaxID=3155628 RepID=UPI0033C841A6